MKKQLDRRRFLYGTGAAALALPLLPSLYPRSAASAPPARPPRLLWLHNSHGHIRPTRFYPNVVASQTETLFGSHQVTSGAITSTVSGADRVVSPALSAPSSVFTESLVSKMSVLQGLDMPWYISHNTGFVGNFARNDGNGSQGQEVQNYPRPTVDQILGWSPKFYPDLSMIKERVMISWEGSNLSWNWSNPTNRTGTIDRQPGFDSSIELFNRIFTPPDTQGRRPMVDAVLESYQSLRNTNRRLSAEDRRRLDDHLTQVNELQRRLTASAGCEGVVPPTDDSLWHLGANLTDAYAWGDLFSDVLVTAFSCGTSRIGVMGLDPHYLWEHTFSDYSGASFHQDVAHYAGSQENQDRIQTLTQRLFANYVVSIAAKLDAISNGFGGTLLDDTLIVWTQEFGSSTSHDSFSIPVVTFGSAAGAFNTGRLFDYRRLGHEPSRIDDADYTTYCGASYTQFLATVLQGMGLAPADYELWGHAGYGVPYVDDSLPPYLAHYQSTNSDYFTRASQPLPMWYR